MVILAHVPLNSSEVGHISLISPSSTEATFKLELNSPMHSGVFTDVVEKQTTPESDFNFSRLLAVDMALKKSPSDKRKKFTSLILKYLKTQTRIEPYSQRCRLMICLIFGHSWFEHWLYKTIFTHVPWWRKRSLSPLIKFSPVEERLEDHNTM